MFASVLAAAALTHSEMIERMNAPSATRADGLVFVSGFCPREVREEYQAAVASFFGGVCRTLYESTREKSRTFRNPGIVVVLGEGDNTNSTAVVCEVRRRGADTRYLQVFIESPGTADADAMRTAAARGWFLAVRGEDPGDEGAARALRRADPRLRRQDDREEMRRWLEGGKVDGDDEAFLARMRTVTEPGAASTDDVLVFASRLVLVPDLCISPFAGKYHACAFPDAIGLVPKDPRLRLVAFRKASEIVVFGGGRGPAMMAAAQAYSEFLMELGRYTKTPDELRKMLDAADALLKAAFDAAKAHENEDATTT